MARAIARGLIVGLAAMGLRLSPRRL